MKHSLVLKRAWNILWSYRALWIFGMILAMAAGGASGQTVWRGNNNDFNPPEDSQQRTWVFDENDPFWPQFFDNMGKEFDEAGREFTRLQAGKTWERNVIRAAVVFASVMVVLGITLTVMGYPARTAVIKMVDDYEETGEKRTVREGWRMGWSRQAWRLFLVDLLVWLPAFIIFIAVLALALTPIISAMVGGPTRGVLGLVASVGLMVLFFLFAFLYSVVFSLVKPVIYRKIAMEDMSVRQSFGEGFRMFGQFWKEYGLLWLIMKGIDLLWPIVLIPFTILTGVIGLTFGGGVALLAGGNAIQSGDPSMVWSILVGLILLIIVMGVPLAFVGGFRKVYQSTSWTLSYRELKAAKTLTNGDLPEVEAESA